MTKYEDIKTTCHFCGSDKIYRFHKADNGAVIYKCGNCRIQFMNPQYTDEHLANYYSSYIRDESHIENELIEAQTYCLSLVEKLKPEKGNLLELGSGNGFLLKVAAERGWNPTGQEIDPVSAEKLSKRIGIEILKGDLNSINIDSKFDAVMMLHVLEHLKDPVSYLNKIYSVLNENGILFIALPNINSRSSLAKLFFEKTGLKKKHVAAYYDTDHHLFYFTPQTIRKMLEKNGFEVIRIYSGENVNLDRKQSINYIDEKILSKIFWHSSMGVIARKQSS